MRTGHVPMEVLGLEVKREEIGKQRVERSGEVFCRLGAKVVAGMKGRCATQPGFLADHGALLVDGGRRTLAQNVASLLQMTCRWYALIPPRNASMLPA